MLNRVLRITIVVVFAVTGLILTEYLLPYISDYFDYKFYGNGFSALLLQQSYQAVSEFLFLAVWAWHWLLLLSVK